MAINPQISTVTIPCTVLNLNFVDFLNEGNDEKVVGKLLEIPCRDVLYDNHTMWAIPIKDSGCFTGFDYELQYGDYLAKPTFDSLQCFRLRDKLSTNEWIVYGTYDEFLTSCGTCCGTTPIPMPTITERIAPCQLMDLVDDDENPYALFGVPNATGGEKYYAYGSYDNVALDSLSVIGYSTPTLLVAAMNATWTDFIWTLSIDELTVTGTGSAPNLDKSLCVSIITILGSA